MVKEKRNLEPMNGDLVEVAYSVPTRHGIGIVVDDIDSEEKRVHIFALGRARWCYIANVRLLARA